MPPTLTTDRLTLRGLAEGDAPALFDLHSREQVQRFVGDGRTMTDLDEAHALVARRRAAELPDPMGVWAIDLGHRLVGLLLLKPIPVSGTPLAADPRDPELALTSDEVEIGWHLHPDVWGRGLATEAARRVLDHARARSRPGRRGHPSREPRLSPSGGPTGNGRPRPECAVLRHDDAALRARPRLTGRPTHACRPGRRHLADASLRPRRDR